MCRLHKKLSGAQKPKFNEQCFAPKNTVNKIYRRRTKRKKSFETLHKNGADNRQKQTKNKILSKLNLLFGCELSVKNRQNFFENFLSRK